jgi:uncharacterized protein (TIGR01244 family)
MKRQFGIWLALFALPLFASEDLPNLHEPREGVLTSAQPTEAGLLEAAARGCLTVVNLRSEGEDGALENEASLVEALGMRYVWIPVTPDTITAEKVAAFGEAVKGGNVLVHCASANRVGALWLLHRVRGEGAALEEAKDEARAIGLKPSLEETALRWLEENPAKPETKKKKGKKKGGKEKP